MNENKTCCLCGKTYWDDDKIHYYRLFKGYVCNRCLDEKREVRDRNNIANLPTECSKCGNIISGTPIYFNDNYERVCCDCFYKNIQYFPNGESIQVIHEMKIEKE